MAFEFKATEALAAGHWEANQIYLKAKEAGTGKPFYFLDGPPYTSGKVHIGTTWNKVLKDMVLRYQRMRGRKTWDRAGYDMHGLPTEHATEKELGIHGRKAIEEYGKERFIEKCREVCTRNLVEMNKTFKSLGVWMDFDDAYQTISKEYMEGEWWLIKRAQEQGRLYEGERSMTWDMHAATTLAKHELVYQTVTDTSIYVRLRVQDDEYLVVWTTTPWTIPYNLAVMVHPDLSYCKVRVTHEGERQAWWIAKDRLAPFLEELGLSYSVEEERTGKELAGLAYAHPFDNEVYAALKAEQPNVHTILLSSEYVDTSAGTGLVHCAPGCGPEDYEVGYRNGIRPFNTVDEHGYVRDLDPFTGLRAREQDDAFIAIIRDAGALVHTAKYAHEYPFGERSKQPVIFRTTKQWFLRIEDIKDALIRENNEIAWVPQAAYNAFNSWLENLRDNSISRQRYWGTPLPVWRNTKDPDDCIVVGSAQELKELAGLKSEPADLHITTVDGIVIKRDGKEYRRVPDVLDVWVDAGTASWNCLGYPADERAFEEFFPADFILEGKDQIRGWFNLLHVASMVGFGKKCFKACYMHGFVNDAQGRKMSKSVGNYILPEEVTGKYGVDATRYYMIGAANPGFDMNYNFEDLEAKFKLLLVYWNLHQYLIDLCASNDILPDPIADATLGIEERYALARLQETIAGMTNALDGYRLNEAPAHPEGFLLDLSRTYVQLVREKVSSGTEEEKRAVASALAHCMLEGITLLAPICPYFAEHVYLDLKEAFPARCAEESVHLRPWPAVDESFADERLQQDVLVAKDVISAILAAREKAQLGIRWPVKEIRLAGADKEVVERVQDMITTHTNVKALSFDEVEPELTIAPNYRNLGKAFGERTADVIGMLKEHDAEIKEMIRADAKECALGDITITPEHVTVTRSAPAPWTLGESNGITAYLDTTRTPALEQEGFARELTRRIQQARKDAGMVKKDRVAVAVATEHALLKKAIGAHKQDIMERTGAVSLELGKADGESAKIKDASFTLNVEKR